MAGCAKPMTASPISACRLERSRKGRPRATRRARMISAAMLSPSSDDASRLRLLLADIRDVFAKEGAVERGAEISSADIIKALVAIEGRPWAERGKNGKRGKPLT